MDHYLVVFGVHWLFNEGLLEHIASNNDTVVVFLNIVLMILKQYIRLDLGLLFSTSRFVDATGSLTAKD